MEIYGNSLWGTLTTGFPITQAVQWTSASLSISFEPPRFARALNSEKNVFGSFFCFTYLKFSDGETLCDVNGYA
jgi:hypothetical protein